ncbi:MAG: hypothetical protein ACFCVH_03830 [Alphaproteobacteria bacterium]
MIKSLHIEGSIVVTQIQRAAGARGPQAASILPAIRSLLGGRRGLLLLAAAALTAGAAFNWSWLVAAGIAPLLLTALPCVVMCGLGMCMMGGRSCAKDRAASPDEHDVAPALDAGHGERTLQAPRPLVIDGRTGDAVVAPLLFDAGGQTAMKLVHPTPTPPPAERRTGDV